MQERIYTVCYHIFSFMKLGFFIYLNSSKGVYLYANTEKQYKKHTDFLEFVHFCSVCPLDENVAFDNICFLSLPMSKGKSVFFMAFRQNIIKKLF